MASPHCSWLRVTATASIAIAPLMACAEVQLKSIDVDAVVRGNIAQVTIHQQYENQGDLAADFAYRFPLPHNAAIHEFSATIAERVLHGEVMPKNDAAQAFKHADEAGLTTTLLDQRRTNDFQQLLANIPANQRFGVSLRYMEFLAPVDGKYELRFPLESLARFGVTQSPSGHAARGHSDGATCSLRLDVDAGMPLSEFKVEGWQEASARTSVTPTTALVEIPPMRMEAGSPDFLASFRAGHEDKLAASSIVGSIDGEGYFHVAIQAPQTMPSGPVMPRDLVVVLDTSGSMAGPRIQAAISFMQALIEGLNDGDTFQIHKFSNTSKPLFHEPLTASPKTRRLAALALDEVTASGGTDLMGGVDASLAEAVMPGRQRVVLLVTDGEIRFEQAIIETVGLHASPVRRFCYVGVGDRRNDFLSSGVTATGGGFSYWLRDRDAATELAADVFDTLDGRAIEDISVDWEGVEAYDVWPLEAMTLWPGKTASIVGRFAGEPRGHLVVRGTQGDSEVTIRVPLSANRGSLPPRVVSSIWARKRIEQLEEMALYGDLPEVAEEIRALGVKHQLMSSQTSFVLVDSSGESMRAEARPPGGSDAMDLETIIIGSVHSARFDPVPSIDTHFTFRYTDAFTPLDYIDLSTTDTASMRFLFAEFPDDSWNSCVPLTTAFAPEAGTVSELNTALASGRRPIEAIARLEAQLREYLAQFGADHPPAAIQHRELSTAVAGIMLAHPDWEDPARLLELIRSTRGT